jgi:hemerythrin-like domain-containing protein
MSKTWSEILIDDHQTTERVFDAVTRALTGERPPSARLLQQFARYATEYVDGCHHRKEEAHLFPLAESRGSRAAAGRWR